MMRYDMLNIFKFKLILIHHFAPLFYVNVLLFKVEGPSQHGDTGKKRKAEEEVTIYIEGRLKLNLVTL